MSAIWNWFLSFFVKAPVVIEEVKPLVKEGEDIIADLAKILADLKSQNYFSVVVNGQVLLKDVNEFVAVLEKVVTVLKAQKKA